MAAGPNHSDQTPGEGGDELLARLLVGAGNCPADVVFLAEAVDAATQTPVNGDLVTGAGLADRVTVLARIAMVIEAEVARSLAVADKSDVLPHAPVTHLQRHAVVRPGRLCGRGGSAVRAPPSPVGGPVAQGTGRH